jgi:uncharacterized protein YdeI (YjbR/CyaY-like superfamily)
MARSDAPLVHAEDRATWRAWLEANHATASGVNLVSWRRGHGPSITYEEAVEEALCFGWIDSRARSVDATHWIQTFSARKVGGRWSPLNKTRIARLAKEGKLAPPGLAAIAAAKRDGSWSQFDAVDALTIPPDLGRALRGEPPAAKHFAAFPPSSKHMILAWIASAKAPATRARRIATTVELAARNERANHPKSRARGRAT